MYRCCERQALVAEDVATRLCWMLAQALQRSGLLVSPWFPDENGAVGVAALHDAFIGQCADTALTTSLARLQRYHACSTDAEKVW